MILKKTNGVCDITKCEIITLFRKVPHQFSGYLIKVMYYENDEDTFSLKTVDIEIDQSDFPSDLKKLMSGDVPRIYFTDGMCDIDFFSRGMGYVINVSLTPGINLYYSFTKEEFVKLSQWLRLDDE